MPLVSMVHNDICHRSALSVDGPNVIYSLYLPIEFAKGLDDTIV